MVGIIETQKALLSVAAITTDVLMIAKDGIGVNDIPRMITLVRDLKKLASEIHGVLPELKDLDGEEAMVLMRQSYDLIQKSVASML